MWKNCTTVSRLNCSKWECHSDGTVRKRKSKRVICGTFDQDGYLVTKDKCISIHRVILETFKPRPHVKLECDHRNGLRTDNSLANLRWVTHKLNMLFRSKDIKGYSVRKTKKGVFRYRPHFRKLHLKTCNTPEEARTKYLTAKKNAIQAEQKMILALLMTSGLTRARALSNLNWDSRDLATLD